MGPYSYAPLVPGHIRLLSVSITEDDELCASIKHVPFDKEDPIVYAALSYVWGTVGFTVPMRCNGALLHITPTLEEALRQVTKLGYQEPLWVDQICINQHDFQERSHEVKMMNSIFKCARKVLAYLGPFIPSTPLAVIKSNSHLSGSNLDILLQGRRSTCACEDNGKPQRDDWPSWVPDWRQHMGTGCEWGIGQHFEEWHDHWYAAGEHVEEEGENPSDPFALRTRGIILGRAVYVSPYDHFGEFILHGRMREARDRFVDMVSSYPTGQDADIAFAMTMVGGVLTDSTVNRGTTIELYTDTYLDFLDVLTMPTDTPEADELRVHEAMEYHELGFDNDWVQAVLKAYCERRWYVLDTDYVGLGNHHMKEGDVVAKLVGLSVPCVLRPLDNGKGYRFIG